VVREIWFIVTLVTHSSGVSSSWVGWGIHHKCKHSLNPTRLYVSGWVESRRSVLIESHNMLGYCMGIEWWIYIWLYDENVVGSSLPCLLYDCLVCGCSFLAMIINLIDGSKWVRFPRSTRKWRFHCLAIWAGFYISFLHYFR